MIQLPRENIYGHTKKLKFILEHIDRYALRYGQPIALLDFGCGNGTAVSQFLIREGITYYGVDSHRASLDYARLHFASDHAFFLDHVPEGSTFDIIVYADVLEHLSDPVALLKQHAALLKDRGLIIGAIPNGYGPFEMEKRISKYLGLTAAVRSGLRAARYLFGPRSNPQPAAAPPYNDDSGHLQFFTSRSFRNTLQDAGFRLSVLVKGAFLGAPLSELFLLRGDAIARANARVSDHLPLWAVSTWYFTATKRQERE